MTTFDRIKKLADEHKISIAELERKLEFGNGIIRRWDKQNPASDKIVKVANFFDVTTDYLLGREAENKELTENDLSVLFRLNTDGLSEDKKKKVKEEMTRFMKWIWEGIQRQYFNI